MPIYEIWSEGYVAQGNRAKAKYWGRREGESFQEACDKMFGGDRYYDPVRLTHWACQLFDNGEDARKSFG